MASSTSSNDGDYQPHELQIVKATIAETTLDKGSKLERRGYLARIEAVDSQTIPAPIELPVPISDVEKIGKIDQAVEYVATLELVAGGIRAPSAYTSQYPIRHPDLNFEQGPYRATVLLRIFDVFDRDPFHGGVPQEPERWHLPEKLVEALIRLESSKE